MVSTRHKTAKPAAALALALSAAAGACGAFRSEPPPPPEPAVDAAATPVNDAGSDVGTAPRADTRCGYRTCPSDLTCCLPLDDGLDAGCVDRRTVCGPRYGEVLCSDPTACAPGEVCCVTATRGAGQQTFEITRAFCVAADACPDAELQHRLCALGEASHCPGQACKPYTRDVNGQRQDLTVVPAGYAICQ